MEDHIFDSDAKVKHGIQSFTNLLEHPGWKLIEQILDANIEVVRQQLERGAPDETTDDIKILREKLKLSREMRNTPTDMIKKLQRPVSEIIDPDPYETAEEIRVKKDKLAPIDK